nr:DivIVA domain-containing protein [candidate division Zixibacteria bacterium]
MDLTPNEMKNHQFSSSMRGFDKAEVKAFIDAAADAFEDSRAELARIKDDYRMLQVKYEQLHNLEETIKSAVLEAQKNANQILANARKEAQLMGEEARIRADKMVEQKQQQIARLDSKIKEMEYTRETFYSKLRSEIEAHLKLVDSICPQETGMKSEEVQAEGEMDVETEPEPEPERKREKPSLDMKDEDIDNVVDSFGPKEDLPEEPKEESRDEAREEKKPAPENKRPDFNMSDRDIDSAIDRLGKYSGENPEEGETVKDGQSQGKDF